MAWLMMEKKENNKRMQMAHKGQAQNASETIPPRHPMTFLYFANGPGRETSVHSVFSSF